METILKNLDTPSTPVTMEAILALPTAPAVSFKKGDLVMNFGNVARVLEVRPDGDLLVRALPGQAFGSRMDKWVACPDLCQPVM